MSVAWSKDVDAALAQAGETGLPLGPASSGYIDANFLPLPAHINEHPDWLHRFDVLWTPTVSILIAERHPEGASVPEVQ